MRAYREGNVVICNAVGTGVADDKSIYPYVPKMIEFYLGEKPILKNVPTYMCRNKDDLSYTLANMKDLVVKEVHGAGGYGMLIGPAVHAGRDRGLQARRCMAKPDGYIAQPTLSLSTSPDLRREPASRRATSTCGPSCCRARKCRWCPAA